MDVINILLEITIYSGIIFVATMLLKKCFKKSMSPLLHYAVWALLIIRLLTPVTIASPVHLFVIPDGSQTASGGYAAAQDYKPAAEPQANNEGLTAFQEPQAALSEPVQNQTEQKTETRTQLSIPQIVILVWLSGAGLSLMYLAVLYAVLRRKFRRNAACPSKRLKELFEEVKAELGIRSNIKLVCQYEYGTPSLMFPRTLMMPVDALVAMNDEQARFALRHELTHYKRRDHIVSIFLSILNAVYWFNPFVWLAFRQIRTDMEIACDSAVVKSLNADGRRRYASLVVNLFSQPVHRQLVLGMAQTDARKVAEQRVRGIFMNGKSGMRVKLVTALLAVIMLLACFTTACQPTPKTQVVINKNNNALESAIAATAAPTSTYKAPESVKDSLTQKNVTFNINAKVSLPEVSAFPVYEVKPVAFTQDQVNVIGKVLLGNRELFSLPDDGKIYMTKDEIQQYILKLQSQRAKVKTMGDAEFKNVFDGESREDAYKEYDDEISVYKEQYKTAPDVWGEDRKPATLQLTSADKNGTARVRVYAETGNGEVSDFSASNNYTESRIDYRYKMIYHDFGMSLDTSGTPDGVKISKEDAVRQAEKTIEQMGIKNMAVANAGVAELYLNDKTKGKQQCWGIRFERIVNGIAVGDIKGAHPSDSANKQDANKDYASPYEPEELYVCIGDEGILSFNWSNISEIKATKSDNVALMLFDKIVERAKKDLFYKLYAEEDTKVAVNISAINLSLMRIEQKDASGFLLVPVWDFIGDMTEGPWGDGDLMYTGVSYLTLNAIDGSVIDRERGY